MVKRMSQLCIHLWTGSGSGGGGDGGGGGGGKKPFKKPRRTVTIFNRQIYAV